MPLVNIHTSCERVPNDFCETTTDIVAKTLGKPHGRIIVCVQLHNKPGTGVTLTRGGLKDGPPFAVVTIESIGKVDKETNEQSAPIIGGHIAKSLNVKPECVSIFYSDFGPHCVAHGGTLACNM